VSNELQVFSFGDSKTRIVTGNDGEPRWVAKDVAETLEIVWQGTKSIIHVPEEWRGVSSVPTPPGIQEMATLTEQGLYFFLARSDKPKALPFQKWIAGEVLPSIRKYGVYSMPRSYAEALEAMAKQARQIEEANKRELVLIAENNRVNPLARLYRQLANTEGLYTFSAAAKAIYNTLDEALGRNRLTSWMRNEGYLMDNADLEPYQQCVEQGLFRVKLLQYRNKSGVECSRSKTFVTQKGLDYFARKLNRVDTAPMQPEIIKIDDVEINLDDLLRECV
jgi:prophage antirepressor-like protein